MRRVALAALLLVPACGSSEETPRSIESAGDYAVPDRVLRDWARPRSIEDAGDYVLPPRPKTRRVARSGARTKFTGDRTLGGVLPPESVKRCESGGDYRAENSRSSASGAWQIVDGTWGGYGGYRHASDAPPGVQDERAAQLWAGGAGASHWKSCL